MDFLLISIIPRALLLGLGITSPDIQLQDQDFVLFKVSITKRACS